MKAIKITLSEMSRKLFLIISVAGAVTSCDVLESDPDVLQPSTEITGGEIFVLANSPSIVDLNTKLQSNTPVRIALTSPARHGKVTDLGKGLLQYAPAVGTSRARDGFEFTVYTLNNEIIKRDSVVIFIENDSTNLPCNIYPMPDYVYGVDNAPVIIDAKANDIICGGNVVVSVFQPGNFGQTSIVDNKIKYIPGQTFQGSDKIIYKISVAADTARTAYGMVYITDDSVCSFRLTDDTYVFSEDAGDSLLALPVFQNDSLCYMLDRYQVYLKSAPMYGQASPGTNGFNYHVPATVNLPFADHFTYEVCMDQTCKTARVDIKLKKDSVVTCALRARSDSVDITSNDVPTVYLDVLSNDSICGNLKSFTITKSPRYGTSAVNNEVLSYVRNVQQQKNDTLEYKICNGEGCSSAVVYIKREK